jgi:predicted Fe-Mo cluster-binding NifX family protein
MKVAIPMFRGGVSPRFDIAECIDVYDVDVAEGASEKLETLTTFNVEQPYQLVLLLQRKKVDAVICSGCPGFFLRLLYCHGIEVISGVMGSPGELLAAFTGGSISAAPFPVGSDRCCGGKRRNRRGGRGFEKK